MLVINAMIIIHIKIFIFFITLCSIHGSFLDFFANDYWSAVNMAERDGYVVEVHNVTTEDGYILTVHRIPGDEGAQPILLMHGLLCNSALWLVSGKGHSLAYILADQGYDVWLGNARGTTYGLDHVNLTTSDSEFWDFSYHEMSIYDLPAMINHIQSSTTQYPFYIGHSQGTTLFYVLAIHRPNIANSLKLPILLAPVAHVGAEFGLPVQVLIRVTKAYLQILQSFINLQSVFTPGWWLPLFFLKFSCAVLSIMNINCLNVIPIILGYEHPELFDQAILPALLANFPSGTSLKNLFFYEQRITSGNFGQYDYGEAKNLEIYNSSMPPEYDLKKVTQPNVIFLADSDVFVKLENLNKIIQLVPNIVDRYIVNASGFTHLDFVWGKTAKDLVYDRVLKVVNEYSNP